ncbi:MAG: DUF6219 family protein [Eubacteriales bacterium]|nr:DUF6219 family protein [Eubacteriales bacterium]
MKQHKFWACIALFSMIMCIFTGHRMISGHKTSEDDE